MDIGATVCRPARPSCASCPARPWCRSARTLADACRGRAATVLARRRDAARDPPRPVPFERTTRWLRGRLVDRLRDAPPGTALAVDGPLGDPLGGGGRRWPWSRSPATASWSSTPRDALAWRARPTSPDAALRVALGNAQPGHPGRAALGGDGARPRPAGPRGAPARGAPRPGHRRAGRCRRPWTWWSASAAAPSPAAGAADPAPGETPARGLAALDVADLEMLARAFSTFFQLANLAEEKERVRALGRRDRAAGRAPAGGSVAAAVVRLAGAGDDVDAVAARIARLRISPVLTAHPTEARRRTVLLALRRVYALLDDLDDARLTPAGDADLRRRLREEITVLWRTADLRLERPTPLDEVRSAMVFFDTTLFTTTPRLYRALDAALDRLATGLPAGSRRSRRRAHRDPAAAGAGVPALGLLDRRRPRRPSVRDRGDDPRGAPDPGRPRAPRLRARPLRGSWSTSRRGPGGGSTPPAISRRLLADADDLPETMRDLEQRFPREPYRRRLGAVAERLARTRAHLAGLPGPQGGRYERPEALVGELAELGEALADDGLGRVAHGALQDLRWQVETFGFHLASLEVRQHSAVHRAALAALAGPSPALDREVEPGVTAGEVLATFRAMAAAQRRHGEAACRRYVISFTEGPADVRDVLELARLAADGSIPAARTSGIAPGTPVLDVVPLFESADALGRRPDDPGRPPRGPGLPGPPARPRRSPGGDARLLRFEQGVGLPRRALASLPGPGAAGRGRPRGRRGADDLPRPRRRPGAGRRPHAPGRAGGPGRLGGGAAQADRAGRGDRHALREPAPRAPGAGADGLGDACSPRRPSTTGR